MDQHELIQVPAKLKTENGILLGWSPVWCRPRNLRW